jgi:hypothetical protein
MLNFTHLWKVGNASKSLPFPTTALKMEPRPSMNPRFQNRPGARRPAFRFGENAPGPRRRCWRSLLGLAVFASHGLLAASDEIRVVDRDSWTPVPEARIVLTPGNPAGGGRWEFETGGLGLVRLEGLEAGFYRVVADKPGYLDPASLETQARILRLGTGKTSRWLICLARTGVISGRVTDEEGQPLAGVGVFALLREQRPALRRPMFDGREAFTDDQGQYRLYNLPPGEYTLVAAPLGDVAASGGWGIVYYPGHADPSRAEFLEVAPGGEIASAPLRVTRQAQGSVAGRVEGLPAQWQGAAGVALVPREGSRLPVAYTPADKDGRFRFDAVPAGDYRILSWGPLSASGYEDPPEGPDVRYAAGSIQVVSGETTGHVLALRPAIGLEAKWKPGSACEGSDSMQVHPEDTWFEFWAFQPERKKDAAAWRNLPPGRWRLEMPGLDRVCTFAGVQAPGQPAPGRVITLAATTVVTAVTAPSTGEIRGVVRRKDGPARGAMVFLWAAGERAVEIVAPVGPEGAFVIDRLPPGRYTIVARADAPPEGAGGEIPRAPLRRIVLEDGQRLPLDLDLDEGR